VADNCRERLGVIEGKSDLNSENQFERLDTRLGPVGYRCSGKGPVLVFFAGAFANGELWRDVVTPLQDQYRCITIDLPLGAHRWPLSPGADRSATSLARLLLDCLDLLEVNDATVIANDTAGGLLLLSLATDHSALERISGLVLTNCDSYDQFPPDALRRLSALCRTRPRVARALVRLQGRSSILRAKVVKSVAGQGLDAERTASFFGPARRDPEVAGDLVAAFAGFRPELLVNGTWAIRGFQRPVLVVWGEACEFFPKKDGQRLASEFPRGTVVFIPTAKTWIPIDTPDAVAEAIARFVPLHH
jgi:pimeloyl-ACP methyl ester carboxylesterase